MPVSPHAVSLPHAKLRHLCAESKRRNGKLQTFKQVATAMGVAPSRVSQLFGASKKEENINPTNLASIVRCFQDEGIPVEIDAFYLDYTAFVSSISRNTQPKPPASGTDNSVENDPFTPASDEWRPDQPQTYTELAIVQLHAPRPLNSRPDCYYLDTSLRFTTAEYELDGHVVVVGLRQANLTLTSNSYAIAHMSLLGDTARPYKGVAAGLRGITISPPEGDVMLSGNPLDEHYLAIIEPAPAATGRDEVNVVLDAPSRGFAFALKDSETGGVQPPPSFNKDAILNLIYGEMLERCRVSKTGRLVTSKDKRMTVNDTHVRRIRAVLEAETESFATLTVLGELDPAQSFRRADLSGVNFGTDDLSKFDFSYANLSGANLSNTTGLHWSKLVNAQFDDRTMWPNDLRWLGTKKWDRDTYWRLHDSARYDEALAFCRLVQRYHRSNVSARVFEAHMLEAHFGKADEAIELMRKAIEINPREANFHYFLAQALKANGQIGKAKRAYKKAASLTDGTNKATILVAIAELLVECGQGADKSLEIHRLLDDAFKIGKTTRSLVGKIFDINRKIGDVKRSIAYASEMLQEVSAIEADENWKETLRVLKPLVKDGNAGELADALKGMKIDSKLGMLRNALLAIAGEKSGADESDRAVDTIRRQLLESDLDVDRSEAVACA